MLPTLTIQEELTALQNAIATCVPVGTLICRVGPDIWPEGYVGAWSAIGVASDGTWIDANNLNFTGMASVALYDYIGTLYGTFTKNGKVYRRMPDINGSGAFLRGAGGNAAAVGTKQLDAAPNITSGTLSASYDGSFSGASYKVMDLLVNTGSGITNWPVAKLNASLVNAAYGRRNEVAPINYSVYYYIKF